MTSAFAHYPADRISEDAARALRALKNGAFLHLFDERGRPAWRLSTGNFLTQEIAEMLMHDPNVAGAGDSLFGDRATSQTFRWQSGDGS